MEALKPKISILVVEDEAITLEFLAGTLAMKFPDAAIYKALNGRLGLELFDAHRHDIVITDINMPEVSGVQMLESIRQIKSATKFIVLTGDTGKLALEASIGNGFKLDYYIDKPIDFMDLFKAVEQCMGEILRGTL